MGFIFVRMSKTLACDGQLRLPYPAIAKSKNMIKCKR